MRGFLAFPFLAVSVVLIVAAVAFMFVWAVVDDGAGDLAHGW